MKNIWTLLVAAFVAVVILLMMCAFQVRFTEAVVVTRFDRIKETYTPEDAGLHWKWPWPIDQVHRFDTRLRAFDTEFRQLGTEDQKTVVLTAFATWRISDGETFLRAVGREEAAGPKIRDLLENHVSVVLRTHPLSHLVNTNPEEMKYGQIEQEFLAGIKEKAFENYGIEVVTVGIKRLGLPESVTKDVFARMKEDRQKTIKELRAEGASKAEEIKANAAEMANRIIARAEAYAKTLEGEAYAEAAKYYQIFTQYPELADFLKKLETAEKILETGQATLVLDSAKFVPFELLKEAAERSTVVSPAISEKDRSDATLEATTEEPPDEPAVAAAPVSNASDE